MAFNTKITTTQGIYDPPVPSVEEGYIDKSQEDREAIDAAFANLTRAFLHELDADDISIGGPPAALVATGLGFGTDNTKCLIYVADNAGVAAAAAGHTDTNATFDLSGITLGTAGHLVSAYVEVEKSDGTKKRTNAITLITVA